MVRVPDKHPCVDCAKLPPDSRPPKPRPAHLFGRKRLRRCTTCERAVRRLAKVSRRVTHVSSKFGISREDQIALWAYQGERCVCGRKPTRAPDADHDHKLAREHDHPDDQACPECFRMFACRSCNTYLIGRYTSAQLRAVADAIDDPPYQRMRRER